MTQLTSGLVGSRGPAKVACKMTMSSASIKMVTGSRKRADANNERLLMNGIIAGIGCCCLGAACIAAEVAVSDEARVQFTVIMTAMIGSSLAGLMTWSKHGKAEPQSLTSHVSVNMIVGFVFGTPAAIYLVSPWMKTTPDSPWPILMTNVGIGVLGWAWMEGWVKLMSVETIQRFIVGRAAAIGVTIQVPERSKPITPDQTAHTDTDSQAETDG